jgi:hypothetical protein
MGPVTFRVQNPTPSLDDFAPATCGNANFHVVDTTSHHCNVASFGVIVAKG